MFMRHRWQMKENRGAAEAAGIAEQGLARFGIGVLAKGDGWVLGGINGGLVLTQAMPTGGGSHVMVVAAADSEASLAACDQVADHIRDSVRID